MRDWLTIELALGTLLVTSYACVGLLALWAATSPRHWFVRTAVVLAVLAPLLVVPAYEPFIVFVLQAVVIVTGVQLARWWRRRLPDNSRQTFFQTFRTARLPSVNFSLTTLLLATVLIAIAAYVVTCLPTLNVMAWTTVALNGLASGCAVLLGAWMFASRRKLIAWPVAIVLCLALGAMMALADWFFLSITTWTGWPPVETPYLWMFTPSDRGPVAAWLAIMPPVAILALVWWAGLGSAAPAQGQRHQPLRRPAARWTARGAFVSTAGLLALLPAIVLWQLLNPLPVPRVTLPKPNGYDDLVAAGKIASATKFDGALDIDTASTQELAAEVGKCGEVYALVATAMEKRCLVPVDYSFSAGSLPMDEIANMRAIVRALMGKARLAELEGRYDDAAGSYRRAIRLGYAIRHGGLFIDALVGIACSGMGMNPLYHARTQLSPEELDRCIDDLAQLDAAAESYDDIWHRDRVWSQRAMGWHGHLNQLLSELTDHVWLVDPAEYPRVYAKHQAIARLLVCELAITRYRQEHGRWPDRLEQLVPEFLAEVAADPLASDGSSLKYIATPQERVAYSVGRDGDDDAGRAPSREPAWPWESALSQDGDLRLDAYFAPDEEPAAEADEVTDDPDWPY